MTMQITPGDVWRSRLILGGPYAFAKPDQIANTVKAFVGAGTVNVWKDPSAPSFPADWPENRREDVSDFMEEQWFVQLHWHPDPSTPMLEVPTEGQNWRLHDPYRYQSATGTLPPPTLPPGPPTTATGCEILLQEWSKKCGDLETQTPECEALMAYWTKHCAEGPTLPQGPPGTTPPPPPAGTDIGDYAGRPPGDLDKWAPAVLIEAWRRVMNTVPTPQALQSVQAVGRLEGYYGWAGKPAVWAGNHNWGAITCKCPCGFRTTDGYYVNGKWQPYETCFATRATNLLGAMHLVEVLVKKRPGVQAVMDNKNLTDFARAMRDSTYFCRTTGKGKDGKPSCQAASDAQKQADAVYYAKVLDRACAAIGAKTGTGQLAWLDGSPPEKNGTEPVKPGPVEPIAPPAPWSRAGALCAAALTGIGIAAGGVLVLSRKRST